MVEYCFETINWSPYVGFEKPDLAGMIRIAASVGYRWITLDQKGVAYYAEHDGSLATLRAEMERHGMRMLAFQDLSINDDIAEVEALARSKVETAAALGARYLQAGITAPIDNKVIEATQAAARICHDAGMELALEFLPFLPLASIGQTHDLLGAAGLTGRNFVVDSWHFFNGPDGRSGDAGWAALAGIPVDRIAFVQFNDHGPLESDDLLAETIEKRLMPGEGIFDLKRFVATLRASGFDGIIGTEMISRALRFQPIEQVARQLMETTAPYWEQKK
jgi:sugar phosphate isomerase/epimerase